MIGFVFSIIKLLIILCVVATIHEFGHFLAAKFCRVGVREFSIGFGKKLYQKKYKETMYSIRCLPLGGYVLLDGEDEESASENSFEKASSLSKILILVMGVVFNIILAVLIIVPIMMSTETLTNKVTEISETSVLKEAGSNIQIIKINGINIKVYEDILNPKISREKTTIIEYIKNGEKKVLTTNKATKDVGYAGIGFTNSTIINVVQDNSPADNAKLKSGDKILSLDGNVVNEWSEIISYIQNKALNKINVEYERDNNIYTTELTPQVKSVFDLGITNVEIKDTDILTAFYRAYTKITLTIDSYLDIFKGNVNMNDVSSIVGIGVVVSKTEGLLDYLYLLAIISLAIGIANILPFPPLDGGKIVIVLIEAITRKKISIKVQNIISMAGFGILILLSVIIMFNDILKLF